jgi:peroxiredoxin
MPNHSFPPAPEWQVAQWLNTDTPITMASLRGRVVVLHAFQMLCPACATHGLPQAKKMRQLFDADQVAVIGLHTVFEHHEVMTPAALAAFVSEYRYTFPIGIDKPEPGSSIPATMREYQLQGTPSIVLIDRQGRLRLSHFGVLDDMALGAAVGQLAAEAAPAALVTRTAGDDGDTFAPQCDDQGCPAGGAGQEAPR